MEINALALRQLPEETHWTTHWTPSGWRVINEQSRRPKGVNDISANARKPDNGVHPRFQLFKDMLLYAFDWCTKILHRLPHFFLFGDFYLSRKRKEIRK